VLQPALILKGPWELVLQSASTATVAVILLAAAFEDFLWGLGRLPLWSRMGLGVAGVTLFIPELYTDLFGTFLGLIVIIATAVANRVKPGEQAS
jgi:TRAP-type uncharacterized transport system fused permease subunit